MSELQPAVDMHPRERSERERAALLTILRIAFMAIFFSLLVLSLFGAENDPGASVELFGSDVKLAQDWHLKLGFGGMLVVIVFAVDIFTPRKKIATISAVFFGLLVAMLATLAIGKLIDLLAVLYSIDSDRMAALISTIKVLIGVGLAYLGIVTVLQTQDDFRLVIPYVEFAKQMRGARPLLVDSSALIDGRLPEIGEAGLIQAPVLVPTFVISELQLLADSHDKLKRTRGRRGLDVVAKLQRSQLDVSLDETPVPGKAVDQMLVELARQMPAVIVTTDLGLTRVARIQGVRVLNLNDLANAMKPSVVPGEELRIKLVKQGEQAGQAVGYLDDGTMVVAENGGGEIGREVSLMVTSSLQTSAGRLIFGRVTPDAGVDGEAEDSGDAGDKKPGAKASDAKGSAGKASGEAVDSGGGEEGTGEPRNGARSGPFPPKPPAKGAASRGSGRNPRR